jgi:hypothetical protein
MIIVPGSGAGSALRAVVAAGAATLVFWTAAGAAVGAAALAGAGTADGAL